jgi:addiction module RelB/DinJ family antitoxin
MAKTDAMYMRIDASLKAQAEEILSRLGMSPSDAVNIFLSQVVLNNGLPFEVKIPKPSKEEALAQLMSELKKGADSAQNEPLMTVAESRKRLGV